MGRPRIIGRSFLICTLLAAATLTTFWPVLNNDFIRFDDRQYVLDNPHVQSGWTREGVHWAFQAGYASNWHPLTWMSHMLDVELFGLDPGRHHLVSLLFHTANALLLFLLLQRLTRATWPSAAVAALFALHPLHVESVAWASERKDVLSTFFFLLTLAAFGRYASQDQNQDFRRRKAGVYLLALGLYALGLMSKPMLVTLPFVLLLLDAWPLGRITAPSWRAVLPRLAAEKLPFLLLSIVSSIVTFAAQHKGHSVSPVESLPLELRVGNALLSCWNYLGQTFWPANLAIFYPHPGTGHSSGLPEWKVALAALALAAVSWQAWRRLGKEPWLATGWFWYLGTLVPVIGIVQVGGQAQADRYTYIPLIGIFICLAWGLNAAIAGKRPVQIFVGVAGALAVLACGVVSRKQAGYWRNNYTVFVHALAVNPGNAVAHYQVGLELDESSSREQALFHFRKAVELDPAYVEARCSLGRTLHELGKTEEALEHYEIAARLRPWDSVACDGLGSMYWILGRRDEALIRFTEAVRLDPNDSNAHYNLGVALQAKGDLPGATKNFSEAVRLKPDYLAARNRLAEALVRSGRPDQAAVEMQTVTQLWPSNAMARVNLGDVLLSLGRQNEALGQYNEALRLSPDSARAHFEAARILQAQTRLPEALGHFEEAFRLQPDLAPALLEAGRIRAVQGDFAAALSDFRKLSDLWPTNAEVHLELGKILMASGHTNEAASSLTTALQLQPDLFEKLLQKGNSLADQGQLEAALGGYTVALWLKPEDARAHESLGLLLARQGKMDEAIAQFEETLRLRPDAQSHYNLGLARVVQGRAAEAVTHYEHAIQLNPAWPNPLNNLAWILATNPQAEVRNGPEAVRLAERACQLDGKQPHFWGTLDAAYAEAGRFAEAIATAEKARDLARAAGQETIANAAENRIRLYQAQKPFHQQDSR